MNYPFFELDLSSSPWTGLFLPLNKCSGRSQGTTFVVDNNTLSPRNFLFVSMDPPSQYSSTSSTSAVGKLSFGIAVPSVCDRHQRDSRLRHQVRTFCAAVANSKSRRCGHPGPGASRQSARRRAWTDRWSHWRRSARRSLLQRTLRAQQGQRCQSKFLSLHQPGQATKDCTMLCFVNYGC